MRVHPVSNSAMSEDFKDYLCTYCNISNVHGVHYLASKRSKTERVVWALLLTLSICCCVFMISKIWQKYERNPIVISFGTEPVSIHQVPFPAVTICPEAQCADNKFNYTDVYYKVKENVTVSDEDFKKFSYLATVCDGEESVGKKIAEDDFFRVLEAVKPDFKVLCWFLDEEREPLVPIITERGICHSFNILSKKDIFRDEVIFLHDSKNISTSDFKMDEGYDKNVNVTVFPLRAHRGGMDDSLVLEFYSDEPEKKSECSSLLSGVSIWIHNPMEIPQFSQHFLTTVPSNKMLYVKVTPDVIITSEEVKRFSADKRKCYLSHERALKFFWFYTESNCGMECLTNFTLKKCGCTPFYLPRMEGDKICGGGSEDCVSKARDSMLDEEMVKKIAKERTECDCLPACTEWNYKSESSLLEMDLKKFYTKKFGSKLDNVSTSSAMVAFKSSQFMVVERKELYGIFDFISNFGGLLGLFIGFSIISLLEIVYFCTWRVFFNRKLYGRWNGYDKKSETKQ